MHFVVRAILPLATASVLAACSAAQVRMPAPLAAEGIAYEVQGHSPRHWRQPLRFGPHATRALADAGTFAWAETVEGTTLHESVRPYRFILETTGGEPVEVECRTQHARLLRGAGSFELDASAFNEDVRLECGLFQSQGGSWLLTLNATRRGGLSGSLERGVTSLAVTPLHGFEGSQVSSSEVLGYAIGEGTRDSAAVDLLNAGRVVLASSDARRTELLAAASAALLLFGSGE